VSWSEFLLYLYIGVWFCFVDGWCWWDCLCFVIVVGVDVL